MFLKKLFAKKFLTANFLNKEASLYKNMIIRRGFSVIGLDMGGSNTCIAIMEQAGPRVIENAEGLRTSPSFVCFSEDGLQFTAVAAKRVAIQNIHNSFYGTKFFFGRKFSEEFIQNILKRFPFKIEKGDKEEIYFLTDKNEPHTAKSVSALYLKYVREQAEALIGKPVRKVVMSVPGFINDTGKQEIKESVKLTGMDVVKFIEESKASAYAYGLDKNEKVNKVIVFNFGGLNFSLSYLEKLPLAKEDIGKEGETLVDFEIKNEFFDYYLGGEDIDDIIIKYLLREFEIKNKMDISNELFALQRIKEAAEKTKIELSLSQQTEINLPFLAADHTGPKHLSNLKISRSKFEAMIDPIITKLKQDCENFLKNNKIDRSSIDDVILVGGVSRIPRVQEIIKQVFGREANKSINPEEAPAMGAAILASQIKLKIEEIKVIDKLPLSIGIETLGGNFTRIIPKDLLLPLKITKIFTTVFDNQPKIELKLYFGEREIAAENKFLGSFTMNLPLTKKGECKINVTFNANIKGDLNILAEDDLSKKKANYSTKFNTDLTQEYIEDSLELSSKLKESDNSKRDLINLKVEADNFVYNLDKLMKENIEDLKNEDDIERVRTDIENLNELLNGEEFEKIISKYQILQKDLGKIDSIIKNNKI